MSKSVDERVVQMKFENRDFEKGVKESLGTLEKLKSSLDFDKAEKNVTELQRSFNKFDVGKFDNEMTSIANRFSVLGIAADQVIRRITDGFIDAALQAKNFISSLTFDQIDVGWDKYESKTASIQTIMNSTGASIDEVNYYLDQLMWFSDETSYSFTDMAAALGQMTSAGGDMETLVPMIMGIANAAAFAGKGTQEFSRAIYNLNQSYSSGSLKYMDWKSLEMAGVASKQLKQTLIDTAVAMGRIKEGEVTLENFNEKLKDDWADQSVMETAFGKFAMATEEAYKLVQAGKFDTASEAYEALEGHFDEIYYRAARAAQEAKSFSEVITATQDAVSSGWMKTFELIFGNYEEAKVLWTDMANAFWEIFAGGAQSRNELLAEWHDAQLGGYKDFVETINIFLDTIIEAKAVLGQIVYDILPDIDTPHLTNAVMSIKEFAMHLKTFLTGETPKMESVTSELVTAMGAGSKKEAFELMVLQGTVTEVGESYLQAEKNGKLFQEGFAGLISLINIFRKGLITLKNSLTPLGTILKALGEFGLKIFASLGKIFQFIDGSVEATDGFRKTIEKFAKAVAKGLDKAGDAVYNFVSSIFQWDEVEEKFVIAGEVIDKVKGKFEELSNSQAGQKIKGILEGIAGVFGVMVDGLSWLAAQAPKVLPYIVEWLKKAAEWGKAAFEDIGKFFGHVKDWIENAKIVEWAKAAWEAVDEWISPAIEKVKEFFRTLTAEDIRNALGGIFSFIGQAAEYLGVKLEPIFNFFKELFGYIIGGNFEGFKNLMMGVMAIFGANALMKVGWVSEQLEEIFSRFNGREKLGSTILKIGIGLAILTAALYALGTMSEDTMNNGLFAIGALLTMLGLFMRYITMLAPKAQMISKARGGLLGLLLGDRVKYLGELTALSSATKAMIRMSIAIWIFAKAVKELGELDANKLDQALAAIGTLLLMVGGFSKIVSGIGATANKFTGMGLIALGKTMVSLAFSMLILAAAFQAFYLLSQQSGGLDAGLTVLAVFATAIGALALAASSLNALSFDSMSRMMLSFAFSMLILVPALWGLAKVLELLSGLQTDMLLISMSVLAGLVSVLALSMRHFKLQNSVALLITAGALIALAEAIYLMGDMDLKKFGKGLLVIGITLGILVATTFLLAKCPAILAGFGTGLIILATILVTFLAVLTTVALVGPKKIAKLLDSMVELAPKFKNAVVAFITATCAALNESIPIILNTLGKGLFEILSWLAEHSYEIGAAVTVIIGELISGIESKLQGPDGLVAKVVSFITTAASAIAEAIRNNDEIEQAVRDLVASVFAVLLGVTAEFSRQIPVIGNSIADALIKVRKDYLKNLGLPDPTEEKENPYGITISDNAKVGNKWLQDDKVEETVLGFGTLTLDLSDTKLDGTDIFSILLKEGLTPGALIDVLSGKAIGDINEQAWNETVGPYLATINTLVAAAQSGDKYALATLQKMLDVMSQAYDLENDPNKRAQFAQMYNLWGGYFKEKGLDLHYGTFRNYQFDKERTENSETTQYTDSGSESKEVRVLSVDAENVEVSSEATEQFSNQVDDAGKVDPRAPTEGQSFVDNAFFGPLRVAQRRLSNPSLSDLVAYGLYGPWVMSLEDMASQWQWVQDLRAGDWSWLTIDGSWVEYWWKTITDPETAADYPKTMSDWIAGTVRELAESAGIEFKDGLTTTLGDSVDDVSQAAGTVVSSLTNNPESIGLVGQATLLANNFLKGLEMGLQNTVGVVNSALNAADSIVKSTKLRLEVQSPSKVAEEIGQFWDLGLINGLHAYSSNIEKTSEDVSNILVGSFANASKSVSDFLNGDLDNVSALSPVMKLGDRTSLSNLTSAMENQNRNISAIGAVGSSAKSSQASNVNTKNYGDFTINVYAAKGQDPKAIAEYVMDEIQAEMERREAALA